MTKARHVAALAVACAVAAVAASTAGAATPRQIYQDYLKHGRLTQHYSKADLERALRSAVLQGYTHGHTKGTKGSIKGSGNKGTGGAGGTGTGGTGNTAGGGTAGQNQGGGLPFTGLDLGLMSFGAVVLLAFGAGLRRFGRAAN